MLLAARGGASPQSEGRLRHGLVGSAPLDGVRCDVELALAGGFEQVADGLEGFVVHLDEGQGLPRCFAGVRVDGCDGLAHAVNLAVGQQGLVRLDGTALVVTGDVPGEEHGTNALRSQCPGGVVADDARPRVGRGQHHAVQ